MRREFFIYNMPFALLYEQLGFFINESSVVNMSLYVAVHRGVYREEVAHEQDMLNSLYREFNLFEDKALTKGYAAHSMSAGDIIQLRDQDTKTSSYYLCQSVGWRRLNEEEIFEQRGLRI